VHPAELLLLELLRLWKMLDSSLRRATVICWRLSAPAVGAGTVGGIGNALLAPEPFCASFEAGGCCGVASAI
jgi:hypothetical protein